MSYRRIKKLLILLTVVTTISLIFCTATSAQSDEKQLLSEQFPDGFKLTKPVAFYDSGNLFELINGQAIFYLSYGFVRLEHAFYEKDDAVYTVDVYELRDRLSALGSYRQQKDDEAGELKVGCEGYIVEYLSTFYKDRYYIEIIPMESDGKNNREDISLLASHVEKVIPGTTEFPPELVLFPQDGMIPKSELYIGENLLSYTFLGHGLTAQYKQKGENSSLRVFISLAENEQKAQTIKEDFRANIKSPASIELSGNVTGVKGTMAYRGNAMIFNYCRYAFGCLGYTDEDGALKVLTKLHENLRKYTATH